MNVPGHETDCKCPFCENKYQYAILPSGKYVNVTTFAQKGSPWTDTPAQKLLEKPCPPVEYRRGKPLVPKGKRL
jgi:hypothetical protein